MAQVRARVQLNVGKNSDIPAEIVSFSGLNDGQEHVEKDKEHNLPCLLLRDGEMMARGCLSISLLEDGGSTYDVERASFVRLGVAY